MGCTQTKSLKSKKNSKNNHETTVSEIIQIVEDLDDIKEKYIFSQEVSIDFHCAHIMTIEEFLLTSYKTNRFSKEQLQLIYQQIYDIFKKIELTLRKINIFLEQKEISEIKPEVEEVYNDFINIFTNMTQRILSMPAICFDKFDQYEVSKCITSIDSQSIIM